MAIDKDLFGPQGEEEAEAFALESLVFSVQIALQKAMSKRGVTSKDLAERLGMTPARVSQIFAEKGPNLTLKTIAKVQAALGEEFEFISKNEGKAIQSKTSAQIFSMIAHMHDRSPWREVRVSNTNRKAEAVAA